MVWFATLPTHQKNGTDSRWDDHNNVRIRHDVAVQFVYDSRLRVPACTFLQDEGDGCETWLLQNSKPLRRPWLRALSPSPSGASRACLSIEDQTALRCVSINLTSFLRREQSPCRYSTHLPPAAVDRRWRQDYCERLQIVIPLA